MKNKNILSLTERLNLEINNIFKIGSIIMIIISSSFILAYIFIGHNRNNFYYSILILLGICLVYSIVLFYLSNNNKIKVLTQYIIAITLVSIPGFSYLIFSLRPINNMLIPTETPFALITFLFIIITGFFLNARLSIICGIIAGTEYFIAFLLTRNNSIVLDSTSNIFLNSQVSIGVYIFKTTIMIASSILVGLFSSNTKKLIVNIINEENEKQNINRLFGQYVSNEVKEKIINEKKEMIGERKKVAVLFSDIRSFTTVSENLIPEKIVEQLNEYFDRMVMCVTSNGGIVDKFIGDAVMAVFGGLIDLENPCDNSLNAAIMMLDELKKLNEKWKKKAQPVFKIGIGLHYGEVLQGTIGSRERKDFTVIGDAVNTSSRIEQFTKKYSQIVFSESFYNELSENNKIKSHKIGKAQIKGKQKEILLYGVNI